jgi:hypothetical protein
MLRYFAHRYCWLFLVLLWVLVRCLVPLHAEECVLVDVAHGVAPAPIFVARDAPPRTREAAATLAEYLRKITGATFSVVDDPPAAVPERGIWVGVQPPLAQVFSGLDLTFAYPEEILIAANARHLVIAGRDRWDPRGTDGWGRLAPITGRQQEYGTLNAVYTFLQERAQVRWLWPGDLGEDILPQSRLAFAPFTYRYHPQFRARAGMFVRWSLGDAKEGPQQLWSRRQRVQLDSLELTGGHGFGDWWDRYHEAHPDYFALQPDGTRSGFPGSHEAKLCDTNPAVWQQWLAEVAEKRTGNPVQRVFNASPNDGWDAGHCVCARCRAWDHPQGAMVTYRWKGMTEERPAISDRHVTFANTLARQLKARYPGQELYVQLHAYGLSRPAPVAAVPDDNVIITSVSNFLLRGDGVGDARTKSRQQFADWSKKAPHLAWRPNLGNPAGLQWGMPDVAMTQTAEDMRFVAEHHGMGLFFDMLWGHWATQGPEYYLLAQLAWNPYSDATAVMDDYYRRAFGPAAVEMQAYWTLLEATRMAFVREVPNRRRVFDLPKTYTPELLARAGALLDQADATLAAAHAPAVYQQRVAFVRAGFTYARLVVDTRAQMQQVEASKGKDAAAAARVTANWAAVAQMKTTAPPFAINFQAVFNKPESKDMIGLHPDNPLSGRVKREFERQGEE